MGLQFYQYKFTDFRKKPERQRVSLCYPHFVVGDIEMQSKYKLLVHYSTKIQKLNKIMIFLSSHHNAT